MLRVIIKSIERQHVLDDGEFAWIKCHLNQPLRIMSIGFDQKTDEIWMITVRTDSACDAVITVFTDIAGNRVKYELVGGLPIKSYREARHEED